ncbi:MAG: acetyl-CoA carboxylase carboxyltransferase subunit alpha [Planctomycetota bacterium]
MPATYRLEFEKPLLEVEEQLAQLERASADDEAGGHLADDIKQLRRTQRQMLRKIYAGLSAWDTVRVARHPERPQTRDYIAMLFTDFCEVHGDRRFGDDPAMVVGFARLGSRRCLVVGHQKGRETAEKVACHFGCAHPEGYRKALRGMKLAEKFGLPIVTFVDTPGAYPGIGAEERGQAEAIAVNLLEMSRLETPIVSVVIGEGGSGGALGIALADQVAMLEHAWYSVISPEGCAAILWKESNPESNAASAEALALTAKRNKKLGVVDEIIKEPIGGAHRAPRDTANSIEQWLTPTLDRLCRLKRASLPARRYDRFRTLGAFREIAEEPSVEAPTTAAAG